MFTRNSENLLSSTSKEAKKIIRDEIEFRLHSHDSRLFELTAFDIKRIVGGDSSSTVRSYKAHRKIASNYCDLGGFALTQGEEISMLKQIYGDRVTSWPVGKVHNTYRGLISREYAILARNEEKQNSREPRK